jgi:hypothetical protein
VASLPRPPSASCFPPSSSRPRACALAHSEARARCGDLCRRGKGSHKGKRGDEKARIIWNGVDVTPRSLSGFPTAISTRALNPGLQGPDLEAALDSSHLSYLALPSDAGPGEGEASLAVGKAEFKSAAVGAAEAAAQTSAAAVGTGEDLSAEELAETVTVEITETETLTLFALPSYRVWSEDDEGRKAVEAANASYEKLLQNRKLRDSVASRAAQTFTETQREKEVQAAPPALAESGTGVTAWQIFDAFNEEEKEAAEAAAAGAEQLVLAGGGGGRSGGGGRAGGAGASGIAADGDGEDRKQSMSVSRRNAASNSASQTHTRSNLDGGSSSFREGSVVTDAAGGDGSVAMAGSSAASAMSSEWLRVAKLSAFRDSCRIVEYVLWQNELQAKQRLYRDPNASVAGWLASVTPATEAKRVPPTPSKSAAASPASQPASPQVAAANAAASGAEEVKPQLLHLWSYASPQSAGLSPTCADWNRINSDLLAVGYGDLAFGNQREGVLMLWSLKNPEQPERVIHVRSSVTSVDFCASSPNLLAVGMYDGSVAIYDIRDASSDKPLMESAHASGKHSEPVWAVKWVQRSVTEGGQNLVSVSTDGTVQQWSSKKGLVPHLLMQLKRTHNPLTQVSGAKGSRSPTNAQHVDRLSRHGRGLCIDFPPTDETQYMVGTEEGVIHKCSVSYNEQTLDNFFGHTSAVFRVRCSPFVPDAFISCSADWSSALWTQKESRPIISFHSGASMVRDVRWAPGNSCVFAAAHQDGRLELWNLQRTALDPVISHRVSSAVGDGEAAAAVSCVLFGPTSPVLLAGMSTGEVHVYRVVGVPLQTGEERAQQADRLVRVMNEHAASEQRSRQHRGAEGGADAAPVMEEKQSQ